MVTLAVVAAMVGTYFGYSAIVLGQRSILQRSRSSAKHRTGFASWLVQAGVVEVRTVEFVLVVVAVFFAVMTTVWVVFGTFAPAVLAGLLGGTSPLVLYRRRRSVLQEKARDAWPYLIEEIRLLAGALGRSLPVATLEAGRKAPTEPMRLAFDAAHREWLLTTDFGRATVVLKERLADPTADVICETLLVAHEIGGADIDRRLAALVEDRRTDLRHRQESRSRQAGVRFARWFVLVVPIGMALVGLGIGDGRAAYQTTGGQIAVAAGILLTAACWVWASHIMRLPDNERVLTR